MEPDLLTFDASGEFKTFQGSAFPHHGYQRLGRWRVLRARRGADDSARLGYMAVLRLEQTHVINYDEGRGAQPKEQRSEIDMTVHLFVRGDAHCMRFFSSYPFRAIEAADWPGCRAVYDHGGGAYDVVPGRWPCLYVRCGSQLGTKLGFCDFWPFLQNE